MCRVDRRLSVAAGGWIRLNAILENHETLVFYPFNKTINMELWISCMVYALW